MDASGGMILTSPERAAMIVVACAVLHNICVEHNIPIRRDNDWDAMRRPRPRPGIHANVFAPAGDRLQRDPLGAEIRNRLVLNTFQP